MSATYNIIAFCICGLSILSSGCDPSSGPAPATQSTDVGPTYVRPSGTGAAKIDGIDYQYVATREREAQIVAGFPKLKPGDTREQVRNALGPPDVAEPMNGKAYNSFLGWNYQYYTKQSAGGPSESDACVLVFFEPNGKLTAAVPENMAGLEGIADPAHRYMLSDTGGTRQPELLTTSAPASRPSAARNRPFGRTNPQTAPALPPP